ncbi:chromosome segregation protein SMC [Neobacillus massiliamazoniensis]|uniref:Chromosome partition protein Smc n=1 Tax=Neobacillus massiliamazoniensis TaxID=1499688 RepID=A0A0U1NR42_9BACI|nr:chromosome segregation protein SMC [Neobacillus massiliamazoniensis]CRK80516.1 chromosome condensation and segregation SMC ATPase [Neobacillus massiliamazoniensis]
MYLKRLDIIGFKSFADRIGVDFVPGVTAVVGPNGSGKSNITDAIRWVLGEQSAKSLRGSKMEDIIFAGSDTRKALNFAEVSLTLDNEEQGLAIDYNEVSVTRRVSRSGDSDFFINKQPCRLKDIVDLFMDSGLGKEAFSIISQGKVEEILNSKAEDRRTIFEEAAGVLKYKNRKRQAEGKLTETQDNLNRVNDIIHELESQVEPLKIQASIAKDYLEKKDELEKIEVSLTVYEIEDLHHKWERFSKQLLEHQQEELKLSAEMQKKEAKMEETRDHLTALDESISSLQNVLLHATEELEKLEGRKEVLKERKKNASQNKEQLEKNIQEITEKISLLKKNSGVQEEAVRVLNVQSKELQRVLKEKQEKMLLFAENIDEKIEALKSEYFDLLNEQTSAKNEIKYIDQQFEVHEKKSNRLDAENDKFLKERQIAQTKKIEVLSALEDIQRKLADQVAVYRNEERKRETVKTNYQKQEKTLYDAYQILQKAKSRKEMLEEMEEEFSGFFQGVKEVLKARGKNLNGIEGAVAELVSVPKEYDLAFETALGGALQHIVVDHEQNARAAIQFLKQNGYGRATFLPLSVIKGRTLSAAQLSSIQHHPSLIGPASSLVSFEKKYEDVISNLLGNVVIAKDLKGANELAKLLQYRCRIVTVDGDIVNPGGSMTGGAVKQKTSSLLSRKTELEDLKGKLVIMDEKTTSLENLVKTLKKEVQEVELQIEGMRKDGENHRLNEQSLKGDLREAELEEKTINDRLAIYDLENAQFKEEQGALTSRRNELFASLDSYKEKIATLENQMAILTEQKTHNLSSKEMLINQINDVKVELAAKNEQFVNAKERLVQTKEDLNESERKLAYYNEDLQLLSSEMTNSSSGEEQLEVAVKRKQQDKDETIQLISSRRQERLELAQTLEDMEVDAKEIKRVHKGMVEVLKDEEVKINRLDVELENRLAHLREEYLLSFEAAKEQYPLTIPIEEAKKKVKLIKLAIEELGNVNLGAIEEYERVSERYEFLSEQKTDLQEAKDTLFQVIEEMDVEMKRRFKQTFEGIRTHFEPVFRALFGGGRADLRLTEPEDLLKTGVEIVAQPPGKKLQNLALLSGGERALTAIALLFSILKIRPVPFCILDEVEAALDEANVYRFSQYLKRYSSETQFIVITHRKGTMEEADVLYGVTMQESGVSKLVSVRLEDTKELVES